MEGRSSGAATEAVSEYSHSKALGTRPPRGCTTTCGHSAETVVGKRVLDGTVEYSAYYLGPSAEGAAVLAAIAQDGSADIAKGDPA